MDDNYFTFSNGKSGLNWFFSYLFEINILEEEDYHNLCSDNFMLQRVSLNLFHDNNWDFLLGRLGISYYALFISNGFDKNYFKLVYK